MSVNRNVVALLVLLNIGVFVIQKIFDRSENDNCEMFKGGAGQLCGCGGSGSAGVVMRRAAA